MSSNGASKRRRPLEEPLAAPTRCGVRAALHASRRARARDAAEPMGRASSPARRLLFLTSACEAPDPTHRSRQLKQAQRKHCCIYFALHAERHCRGKLAHVGHRSTDARQLAFAPEAPARPSPRCSLSELQCTPTEDSQLDVGKDESMCRLFVQVWTRRQGQRSTWQSSRRRERAILGSGDSRRGRLAEKRTARR